METKINGPVGRHHDKVTHGNWGVVAFVSWERRERKEVLAAVRTATILNHPPSHSQATPPVWYVCVCDLSLTRCKRKQTGLKLVISLALHAWQHWMPFASKKGARPCHFTLYTVVIILPPDNSEHAKQTSCFHSDINICTSVTLFYLCLEWQWLRCTVTSHSLKNSG